MERVISLNEAKQICDNDEEFLNEMITLMRQDMFRCLTLLAKAFNAGDTTQMRQVAHRIKGQSASLAATKLWRTSKNAEDAAKLGFCTKMEYLCLILSVKEFIRCTRELPQKKI